MNPAPATDDFVSEQPHAPGTVSHTLSGFIAARLELVSIEAKEAASYTGKKVVHGIVLALSAFFLWSLLLAATTGILAPIADQWLQDKIGWLPGWAAVALALAIMHGIIAIACYLKLTQQPTTPLFELSRKEIENDKLWLAKNK